MKTIMQRWKALLLARRVRRFPETKLGDVGPLDWGALMGEMEEMGLRLRWHKSGATLSMVGEVKRSWTVSFTRQHTVADVRREARYQLGLEVGPDVGHRVPWGERLLFVLLVLLLVGGMGAAMWLGGLFMQAEAMGRMDGDGRKWTEMEGGVE